MSVVTGHATIENARAFIVNHIQSYAMHGKSRDGWSMTGFPCGTEEGDTAHFKEVVARVRNVNEGKYDHMSILDALSTLTNPSTKATPLEPAVPVSGYMLRMLRSLPRHVGGSVEIQAVRRLEKLGYALLEDNGSLKPDGGREDGERWFATVTDAGKIFLEKVP